LIWFTFGSVECVLYVPGPIGKGRHCR
jgi:hypothetical protein